jgi:3-deoxy-manno-octulosonate cytidylyltransferase (CMP-KDO synthetase)
LTADIKQRVVAVIPARLASTRLPRKMLRELAGQPLLGWVYRAAQAANGLDRLVVATDAPEIADYCRAEGFEVEMTSSSLNSGTDRVHAVAHTIPADIYVNIQGDEPLLQSEQIDTLVSLMRNPEVEVGTLKTRCPEEDVANPNAVKVVTDTAGRALYFSRATIPFDRDGTGQRDGLKIERWKHLGFYAYQREALARFPSLPPSRLEAAERLEQLRFLEAGISIHVAETAIDTIGVDTEDDLRRAEQRLLARRG